MLRHWWGPRGRGSRWWQQSASDRRTSVHKREPVCFSFARRAIARARKIGESGENRSGDEFPFVWCAFSFEASLELERDGTKFAKTGARHLPFPPPPLPFLCFINRNETPSGCRDSSPLDSWLTTTIRPWRNISPTCSSRSSEKRSSWDQSRSVQRRSLALFSSFFLPPPPPPPPPLLFSRVRRRLLDELAYGCNARCWWLRFHVFAIPSDRWSSEWYYYRRVASAFVPRGKRRSIRGFGRGDDLSKWKT